MPDPVISARNRLAGLHVGRNPDPAAVAKARTELSCAKVERAITEALASAPPITAEQRAALAAMLLDGAR